ncbi:MAG: energy transducer TonB, partial [Candidatus Zixiibacteriota bacterium]
KRNNLPYCEGNRQIDQRVTISGKSRQIKAEIDNGEVIRFQWDNIKLTDADVNKNWDDIVSILKIIDENKYDYIPPEVSEQNSQNTTTNINGLLNSPENYTGDKIKTTSFSKAINIVPGEKTELDIPFKDCPLPFSAREYISLSDADEFVAVDIMPEMIHQSVPEYPINAKNNKIEAKVYVRALVDKKGEVKDVKIVKSDNPGLGFEEAAEKAAYACRYKPGIKNGEPITIWVTYCVTFKMDNH